MPVTANFAGPVQTDATNHFRMLQSMAIVSNSVAATAMSGNWTQIKNLNTGLVDTDGMWNGAVDRVTAPIPGKYLVSATVTFAANPAGSVRAAHLGIGGSRGGGGARGNVIQANQWAIPGSNAAVSTLSQLLWLNASEYVGIWVYQDCLNDLGVNVQPLSMIYVGE